MLTPIGAPDVAARPHALTVERSMRAAPAALYRAWTERFDDWFAAPGAVRMTTAVDAPFFFAVRHEGSRHPHDGRFLRLEPDRLDEITWLTGAGGTEGAETVVTIELAPAESGTRLRLTHAGFRDETSRDGHEHAWPSILAHLDQRLRSSD